MHLHYVKCLIFVLILVTPPLPPKKKRESPVSERQRFIIWVNLLDSEQEVHAVNFSSYAESFKFLCRKPKTNF